MALKKLQLRRKQKSSQICNGRSNEQNAKVIQLSMHHFVISVPLNTTFKVLFNNHFKRSPEEILKPDEKVPISQALTILSICKLHILFVDSSENCAD